MTEEKPLHVRVAKALGWTSFRPDGFDELRAVEPDFKQVERVPRYDTDWSATGPLIEKYEIQVAPIIYRDRAEGAADFGPEQVEWLGRYRAPENRGSDLTETQGKTVLIAICNLILALKEAGKL